MASIYFSLRSTANKRGEHEIRLTVVMKRKPVYIKTGYAVKKEHWDNVAMVKRSHPSAASINAALQKQLAEAINTYANMDTAGSDMSADTLSRNITIGDSFLTIAGHYAAQFRKAGKIGTADAYDSRAKRIDDLFPGIKAGDMTPQWAARLNDKLSSKSHNTAVGLRKFINAVLNKAERDGIIPQNKFSRAQKGSFRTPDRQRLSLADIEALWLGKPADDHQLLAKLTFLFSYYAAGARFKDVLTMPKSAIYTEGRQIRMKWKPSKTADHNGQWLDIEVNARLKQIIKKAENTSSTIFGKVPMNLDPTSEDKLIANIQTVINRSLKVYAAMCGVKVALSFHDARRALAYHLKVKEADIYTIKDTLGHGKITTTQGYVGRNQQGVDDALRRLYK